MREPQPRPGRALRQGHIKPAIFFRMKITAESLRTFTANSLPCFSTILAAVKPARFIGPAGIARADQQPLAVARIRREVLRIKQWLRNVYFLPVLRSIFRT